MPRKRHDTSAVMRRGHDEDKRVGQRSALAVRTRPTVEISALLAEWNPRHVSFRMVLLLAALAAWRLFLDEQKRGATVTRSRSSRG